MQTPGPSLPPDPFDDPGRGYDVVVLGGGPAGCATALALAQHGIASVLVVESSCYDVSRIGESVPPDTRIVLKQLGIWEAFLNESHEPCLGSCSAWGADQLGYNDFLFNPYGQGWHLDRRRFDSFLARKAEDCGADICTGTRFVAGERTGSEGFRLRLTEGDGQTKTVSARFVVDATGWRASFASQMGASKIFLDQLICVAAFFHLPATAHFSRLTMLEAVEYGWWYAARLPDDQLAVAVACDSAFMKRSALSKSSNWRSHLDETIHISRELAGSVFVANSLRVCTAPSFLLDQTAGDRWLAVGDAASSYDPISSQGIFKALSDGLQAARAIAAFLRGDSDSADDYHASVVRRFDDYLANRNYFYGLERRWTDASFWKTRVARTSL